EVALRVRDVQRGEQGRGQVAHPDGAGGGAAAGGVLAGDGGAAGGEGAAEGGGGSEGEKGATSHRCSLVCGGVEFWGGVWGRGPTSAGLHAPVMQAGQRSRR